MGYPLKLALRYLGAKKRASISVGTAFAILGVALGVAALLTVMSVTAGFRNEFRDKVLGVNAHVMVLKDPGEFTEYREVMERTAAVPGVLNAAPFSINPMMLSHGETTATGVLVKGVDPKASLGVDLEAGVPPVLDLPGQVLRGDAGECERRDVACGTRMLAGLRPGGAAFAAPKVIPTPPRAKPAPAPPPPATSAGEYKSVLPPIDEDPVPGEDPCEDPAAIATMPGVVVGSSLAESLDLDVGSCVVIASPLIGLALPGSAGSAAISKPFRVLAVFEAGFEQYDAKLVYVDLREAQAFMGGDDKVTGIETKIADIDASEAVVRDIEEAIGACSADGCRYRVTDWKQLNHGLFTALLIQQVGMSAVLALIILVAAFTVIATLIMVVLDKTKEISVVKSMGASDGAILRVFLYQGAIIGGIGTSLGLVGGYAVCKSLLVWAFPLDPKVYFISHLPVSMRWQEFAITGSVALVLCAVATLIPSLFAARIRPADGFRTA